MGILDSLIGPVVGGLFGMAGEEKRSDASADAARISSETAERLNKENQALQREFAQHGVRWRVEDAKAAGLHPLYALHSGGASFTPTVAMGAAQDTSGSGRALADMGQNLSRAMMAQQTDAQREIHVATLKTLEAAAAKDFAQASYYQSEAARALATGRAGGGMGPGEVVSMPANEFVGPPDLRPFYNQVQATPAEIPSARLDDWSTTAGPARPAHMEVNFGGGLKAVLPQASSVGEALESLSESATLLAFWVGENQKRFGDRWLGDVGLRLPVIGTLIEGRRLSEDHMKSGFESPDMGRFDEFGRGTSWIDTLKSRRPAPRGVPKWPYK